MGEEIFGNSGTVALSMLAFGMIIFSNFNGAWQYCKVQNKSFISWDHKSENNYYEKQLTDVRKGITWSISCVFTVECISSSLLLLQGSKQQSVLHTW